MLVSYIQQYFDTSFRLLTNQVWKLLIALFKVPNTGAFTVTSDKTQESSNLKLCVKWPIIMCNPGTSILQYKSVLLGLVLQTMCRCIYLHHGTLESGARLLVSKCKCMMPRAKHLPFVFNI